MKLYNSGADISTYTRIYGVYGTVAIIQSHT